MPRNGSGIYSLPPGSTISNGDTSDASDINTPLDDIASDLNDVRPVVAGGTGSSSASGARTTLGLEIGVDVQAFSDSIVSGPSSVTNERVALFDGTTGKLLKQAAQLISDLVTLTGTQTMTNKTLTTPVITSGTLTTPLVNVGSDAAGDLYQRNAGGTGFDRIPVGAAGTALVSDGTKWASGDLPSWTETTPVATTSGTAFDTVIPSGVTEIEVILMTVGTTGNDGLLLQMGSSGTPETTGYVSASSSTAATFTSASSATNGFVIVKANSGYEVTGLMNFRLFGGTTWVSNHSAGNSVAAAIGIVGGGSKTLSVEIDVLRLTSTGANSFDSGQFKVRYR